MPPAMYTPPCAPKAKAKSPATAPNRAQKVSSAAARRFDDCGSVAPWSRQRIERCDRVVEVLESGAGQDALGRHIAKLLAQGGDDRIFAQGRPGERGVAAFAAHDRRALTDRHIGGDTEAGAGAEHSHWGKRLRLAQADLTDMAWPELRQRPSHGFEVVDQLHPIKAEAVAQLSRVNDP